MASAQFKSVQEQFSYLQKGVAEIIREDELKGIGIGSELTLTDGIDGKQLPARVTEMRRLGDFATWRAARAVGDYDLNTFVLRADPVGPVEGLQPGATVWISVPGR